MNNSKISQAIIKVAVKEWIKNNPDFERDIEQNLDISINGTVSVKKGKDYQQVIDRTIPYAGLLALAMSKLNNVTLKSLMKEYFDTEFDIDENQLKENAKIAIKDIKGTANKKCNGKIVFKEIDGEYSILENVPLEMV